MKTIAIIILFTLIIPGLARAADLVPIKPVEPYFRNITIQNGPTHLLHGIPQIQRTPKTNKTKELDQEMTGIRQIRQSA